MSWRDPIDSVAAASPEPRVRRGAALLDLDPELGRFVPQDRRDAARAEIQVRVVRLRRGPWLTAALVGTDASQLGLLVVDGLLGRELISADVASLELLGPGDLLRPWDDATDGDLLGAVVRWTVLADARLAVLDSRVAGLISRYPQLYCALVERCIARSRRLAIGQAISQLKRVDRRLLCLLWHLAERWGKVTPEGVVIPLSLGHRILAQLVGARRPSVSAALGELSRRGEVARGPHKTWILTGTPVGMRKARLATPRDEPLGTVGWEPLEASHR